MAQHKLHSNSRAGVPRARARFLTQSMQLEEKELPGVLSFGILLTTLLIVGSIFWAHITPISEVAKTSGNIIPSGRIHQVQHLEGGIVEAIQVNNGDHVKRGDVLIKLNTESAASELAQVEGRKKALQDKLNRINVMLDNHGTSLVNQTVNMIPTQKKLFEEQMTYYEEQLELIDVQTNQRLQEVVSKREQAKALQQEVAIFQEQRDIHESARLKNVIPKTDKLNIDARLAKAVSQLRDVESQIRVAEESIREAKQKKTEFISRWRQDLRLEAETITSEINEVTEEYNRIHNRLSRLAIVAPVDGVVQDMQVNTLNSVIEPGKVIMELVPINDELVAETRVKPEDIGHIVPGQPVDVNVSSFETQRFGSIDGRLKSVSATTYLDENYQPYYKAEVLLAKNYVGNNASLYNLVPGMTVEAVIHTGEKTILEYILKPIYRGFSGAMKER